MIKEKIKLNIGENDLREFLYKNLKIDSLEFHENHPDETHFYLCFIKIILKAKYPMIIHFLKDNQSGLFYPDLKCHTEFTLNFDYDECVITSSNSSLEEVMLGTSVSLNLKSIS